MYVDEEKQRQKFLQNEVKEIDFCKKPSEKEESDSFWQPDKNNSEKSLPS